MVLSERVVITGEASKHGGGQVAGRMDAYRKRGQAQLGKIGHLETLDVLCIALATVCQSLHSLHQAFHLPPFRRLTTKSWPPFQNNAAAVRQTRRA